MTFNFQRDSVVIARLAQLLRFPLECERQSLAKGEHREYHDGVALAQQWFDRRFEQIRIEELEGKGIICTEYEEGIRQLDQEYVKKLKELEESFFKEQDEQKRALDNEINALDIVIPPLASGEEPLTNCATHYQAGQCQQHPNPISAIHPPTTALSGKKFLRSRQNDVIPSSGGSIESTLHLGVVGFGLADGAVTIGGLKRRTQGKKSGSPFGFPGLANAGGSVVGAGAIGGGSTFGGTTSSSLMLPYLLSESAISEDVHSFCSDFVTHYSLAERPSLGSGPSQDGGVVDRLAPSAYTTSHSAGGEMADEEGGEKSAGTGGRHHRRVLLEQNKLILDAKTFHRFQNVYIELASSGRMPATIRSVSEGRYVEFRSGIPGDTRTFTATKDDLERGRVFVRKRY